MPVQHRRRSLQPLRKGVRAPIDHSWGFGTRAWNKLSKRVAQEEPQCRLRLPGCTGRSVTADHKIPRSLRPDLTMDRRNLRGTCKHCNMHRGNRPLEEVRAEMIASGKWKLVARPAALNFFNTGSASDH